MNSTNSSFLMKEDLAAQVVVHLDPQEVVWAWAQVVLWEAREVQWAPEALKWGRVVQWGQVVQWAQEA